MKSKSLLGLFAGIVIGKEVYDSLDNSDGIDIPAAVTGVVTGKVVSDVVETIADETGISDAIDDLFE